MFLRLLFIALGVSSDAFAVSISKGLSVERLRARHHWLVGLWFGGFQTLLPLLGYFAASMLQDSLAAVDHWIIFGILSAIGVNMIREGVYGEEEGANGEESFSWRQMLPAAIATSIDSFGVGAGLALLGINIWLSALVIGLVTAAASILGLHIGYAVGSRWRKPARIAGGTILIVMGIQILLDHLMNA